jgi:hypothetical protein
MGNQFGLGGNFFEQSPEQEIDPVEAIEACIRESYDESKKNETITASWRLAQEAREKIEQLGSVFDYAKRRRLIKEIDELELWLMRRDKKMPRGNIIYICPILISKKRWSEFWPIANKRLIFWRRKR